ncbi:MAG: glutamyl-tRNA reductase [Ignavibacteriae bacterium]|jgi:glutamyl-tRNA reductase|nr:glutamyl-tRNA reductase [Ignavibacteriota bacterium]NOG97988.1 glutamyl-tRNA reductase [Ignavibacteriota bacterium]
MDLIGISINHKTAPLELRETLFLSTSEIKDLIPKLKKDVFSDGFILSTCNRTEVFGVPLKGVVNSIDIGDYILDYKPVPGIKRENFAGYFACSAIKHIFNVASGVDSLIIGDSQILGQVKESFQISLDWNFAGSVTKRMFDSALKVGKRSINETGIGDGAVSISYAAVQVVEKIFANLNKKSALVIGAGETGELAAVHLKDKEIGNIVIANRTKEKAEKLAEKVNGKVIDFDSIKDELYNFDIVISATGSPTAIVELSDIKNMMKKRKGTPACLVDIAVPRDIDPSAKKIDNVFYHDIDSLEVIVDQNKKFREKEIPKVERIIMEELVNFYSWYNSLEVIPTIKSFRNFFEEIRQDEMEKIKHKIHSDDIDKFNEVTKRLVGRLMHNPTKRLRELSETELSEQDLKTHTLILKELFKLDNNSKA